MSSELACGVPTLDLESAFQFGIIELTKKTGYLKLGRRIKELQSASSQPERVQAAPGLDAECWFHSLLRYMNYLELSNPCPAACSVFGI